MPLNTVLFEPSTPKYQKEFEQLISEGLAEVNNVWITEPPNYTTTIEQTISNEPVKTQSNTVPQVGCVYVESTTATADKKQIVDGAVTTEMAATTQAKSSHDAETIQMETPESGIQKFLTKFGDTTETESAKQGINSEIESTAVSKMEMTSSTSQKSEEEYSTSESVASIQTTQEFTSPSQSENEELLETQSPLFMTVEQTTPTSLEQEKTTLMLEEERPVETSEPTKTGEELSTGIRII